jgi:ubiquinone/menaquinone biosynthesis C-methylase UbiE
VAPRVDYSVAAGVYDRGRSLPEEDMARWHDAVAHVFRAEGRTVLDLGAGTGIFARAWPRWGAMFVVACEPSCQMRSEARRLGVPVAVGLVAGRAEALPLEPATVEAVWLSTVVHHIGGLPAAASEIRRVLVPGGWLLVRDVFADLGTVSWLPELRGAARARRAFPSIADLARLLGDRDLHLAHTEEVTEARGDRTARAAAGWIRRMRHADSLLLVHRRGGGRSAREAGEPPSRLRAGPSRIGIAAFRAGRASPPA